MAVVVIIENQKKQNIDYSNSLFSPFLDGHAAYQKILTTTL